MAAKPREPTPEELKKLTEAHDKLVKDGKVKPHEPKHRQPKGK
jgi:hypothetical protein